MPHRIQTQTLLIQLTDVDETPEQMVSSLLADYTPLSGDYEVDAQTEVTITERETDAERSQREAVELQAQRAQHADRDAKLLSLKGWLYGEHLKQEAGLPSEWDQEHWGAQTSCGTSACIAGKTVLEAGGKFVKIQYGSWNEPDTYRELQADEVSTVSWVRKPNGEHTRIAWWAQELLGLNDRERSALFEGDNTYAMAAAIIDAIIDGGTDPYMAREDARDA